LNGYGRRGGGEEKKIKARFHTIFLAGRVGRSLEKKNLPASINGKPGVEKGGPGKPKKKKKRENRVSRFVFPLL